MGRQLLNRENRYPQPINPEGTKVIKLKFNVQAKTASQDFYLQALRTKPLTLGTGPAGSGKSFLCVAVGLEKLLAGEVGKIVLTRPVLEAGEELGFLPGTYEEKISPYLRPLLDAMEELIGVTMVKKLMDSGKIEFAPLAYMRGRTFNNSYVILDEAQNTTVSQIKLFVTRAGNYSTFVVNGDVTQSDLKGVVENGLEWLVRRLSGRSSMVDVIEFSNRDIQRSELVAELLKHLDGPDERVSRDDPVRRRA